MAHEYETLLQCIRISDYIVNIDFIGTKIRYMPYGHITI